MASLGLAKLIGRKVFKISGPDCYPYLQGLLCNDLRYLYEPQRIPQRPHARGSPNVISAFMLNVQGRAICDLILYRTPSTKYECEFTPPNQATEPDELLIECDSSLANGLANTLYGYRLRRKITLSFEDGFSVWSLFPLTGAAPKSGMTLASEENRLVNGATFGSNEIVGEELTIVADPRLTSMGLRIIAKDKDNNPDTIKRSIQSIINANIQDASYRDYTQYRYLLGVGEGVKDHPESNCLPLECNADFLGSVSFNKGCYLGQELTARIHYTGVVRKRLMPIVLDLETTDQEGGVTPLISGSDIVDEASGQKVGILRNVVKNTALALLRHEKAAESQSLIHKGTKTKISTHIPYWWSVDKSKPS